MYLNKVLLLLLLVIRTGFQKAFFVRGIGNPQAFSSLIILGDPGADSGDEQKVETGGKNSDEEKLGGKVRAPGDRLFMDL